ncbi:MAG: adenine deaminase [Anaerolineae bacterium]|nr:adenine deaminase [Anaerolineae bacterium]
MTLPDLLAAARGDKPAHLALRNARLINVWSGEIYTTDIIIHQGQIAALGAGYAAEHEIDLGGRYVCPGFIDAHAHIESTLMTPPEYARAVVPRGVTSVVTDPHEIANVMGVPGIRYMLDRAKYGPMNIYANAPSCVPATHMETSGARLEAEDLEPLLDHGWVIGLAEVMNYPGVIYGDEGMLDKLEAFKDRVRDGHAPSVTGKPLNAYVAAGIGSDHECTTAEEALEKLRLGLTIFIREGTTTRNLDALIPIVTAHNHTQICFCTDDRQPNTLMDEGSVDDCVRKAITHGIDPIMAIRMVTLNTAHFFRLHHLGMIAPGKQADLIVFSDLNDLHAELVFHRGQLVAQGGQMTIEKPVRGPYPLPNTVHIDLESLAFRIPAQGERIRVIGAPPDQVVTPHLIEDALIVDGEAVADTTRDLLKIAVIERHHASGKIGLGFIKGFGLKRGALAGTVGHDHHNLIVIGVDDANIEAAVRAVATMGGGLVAVDDHEVIGALPLEVAGLMTEKPLEQVRREYDVLIDAAHALGSTLPDPFMTMSFMGLEVIPSLKLTDIGLVDVDKFEVVGLWV